MIRLTLKRTVVSINGLQSGTMPDRHLVVDIETLDTQVTAAILAIGACVFNPRGDSIEDEFHITIDEASNVRAGRSVSQSTKDWWEQQSQEAKDSVFKGPHTPLSIALTQFTQWINRLSPTCTRIWAKSPDFDCSILAHACRSQGIIWPFKFWENRCCRTIMELAYPLGNFPVMLMDGPKHSALADAKVQALEIQHSYYCLRS